MNNQRPIRETIEYLTQYRNKRIVVCLMSRRRVNTSLILHDLTRLCESGIQISLISTIPVDRQNASSLFSVKHAKSVQDALNITHAITTNKTAIKVIFMGDAQGLFLNGSLVQSEEYDAMPSILSSGQVSGAMLKILKNAYGIIQNAVPRVHIISAHAPGALLHEVLSSEGSGTMFHKGAYRHISELPIEKIGLMLALLQEDQTVTSLIPERHIASGWRYAMMFDHQIGGCIHLGNNGKITCLSVAGEHKTTALLELLQCAIKQAREKDLHTLYFNPTHNSNTVIASSWFCSMGFTRGSNGAFFLAL